MEQELAKIAHIIIPMLGKTSKGLSRYLAGSGVIEFDRVLDEFSMQVTPMENLSLDKLHASLGLAFYPKACTIITFFGLSQFGKVVEYPDVLGPGEAGYQPDRILQFEKTHHQKTHHQKTHHPETSSNIYLVRNMGNYGSGGTPGFLLECRPDAEIERHVMRSLESLAKFEQPLFLKDFREKSVCLDEISWCMAARSIQACWRVCISLDSTLGNWLLKIAVHAACTMERARGGALSTEIAVTTLFQLSQEIAYLLQVIAALPRMVPITCVPVEIAAVAAVLTNAGRGFIRAGVTLLFALPDIDPVGLSGKLLVLLARICESVLYTASIIITKLPKWKELATRCIKQSNFCPSRQLAANMALNSRHMFHVMATAENIVTTRKLHSNCGDTCDKAFSTHNHQQAGHIVENCNCSTTYFQPIETAKLVLFDTASKQLKEAQPGDCYVAISQIWFQGIFGQSSKRCGVCTLDYLGEACIKIGVRYAWIDTLCMPTCENLRREVIGQLRNIYLDAKATLVVDLGLISTKAATVLDLSIAIWLSDWSSRVWTLQEGVLASKLLFCVRRRVLALPQIDGLSWLDDPRKVLSSEIFSPWGMGKRVIYLDLHLLLFYAAGRQTSYEQDYLYGLSALLPSVPIRTQDPESVAIEMARMYGKLRVDLGILLSSFDRCQTEGYRWMPLSAKTLSSLRESGTYGYVTAQGLECPVTALVRLRSVAPSTPRSLPFDSAKMDMGVKYWYLTETAGVFVGTLVEVEANHLVFCRFGHSGEAAGKGFVASPTGQGKYQYVGSAAIVGIVPQKQEQIIVT